MLNINYIRPRKRARAECRLGVFVKLRDVGRERAERERERQTDREWIVEGQRTEGDELPPRHRGGELREIA